MSQNVITSTELTNLTPLHRGKVRDLYDLGRRAADYLHGSYIRL